MIMALLILVPVVGVTAWAFFRFSPAHVGRRRVLQFNVVSVVVALAIAGAWTVRTYLVMSPTVDSAWWPVLGALVAIPLVLVLAAIVRKLLVFRRGVEGSR